MPTEIYKHSIKVSDEELRMIDEHRKLVRGSMTRDELLWVLSNVDGLPNPKKGGKFRSIYEAGDQGGRKSREFLTDYATFRGGSSKQVPRRLIVELEAEGVLIRAYPQRPDINCWKLANQK